MGYQPSLDGVRAMSVIAVIFYHAGFSWMSGGFFGVEVFFVVSGFLITSLLIEERDRVGRVDLWQFWVRRWRRLLPALFTMLLVIGVWAVFWGSVEQHTQLRRDYPWGILYLANWGQIFSETAYFSGTPSLFRHLWCARGRGAVVPHLAAGVHRHRPQARARSPPRPHPRRRVARA